MNNNPKTIVIIGAGISGLATAHWLKKAGLDITVLEADSEVGGSMKTNIQDGFLIELGPNSGLETTPLIRQIADETGISGEMIYANETAKKRYILKNDELMALPMSLTTFLKTPLFSLPAKLRLAFEPFIGRSDDGYYQSIAEFVRRRLGKEFLDYAIDPFVSGVFAGDPEKLSVKSAFPKLYRLEELYGGLIKGMVKGAKERKKSKDESKQSAKMFSFKSGMQAFPRAIAAGLGDAVRTGCVIDKVVKDGRQYKVLFNDGKSSEITADIVLSTIPAYKAASVFERMDSDLCERLKKIFYPPVKVLYLGYKNENIKRPLDGFGFLIPSKEKQKFLGSIWSSAIFPNRAPEGYAAFTMFIGGARSPHLFDIDHVELEQKILERFHDIMGISSAPEIKKEKFWQQAIPQYNLGYIEHERYFAKFEKENHGLFLGGNYRVGISVGDCIKSSYDNYEKILKAVKE